MGDSRVDCGGVWLPAEFLTDKDILMDKENFNKNGLYSNTEFSSFGSTRSLGELVTESEREDDYFLARLTRQFTRSTLQETHKIPYPPPRKPPPQKTWGTSVSTQSTLTPVCGTRTMHFKALVPSRNDVAWDMVCAAADGQMNGLKLKNSGPVTPTRIHPPNPNINNLYNNNTRHEESRSCVAWPPVQVQNRQQQVVYHQNQRQSGGGAFGGVGKKECAGTGVFLPRRYTAPPDSRRKSGSTAALPPRAQVARKNFEKIMTTQAQPHDQFNGGGINPQYDLVMAQRDAQSAQQWRNKMMRAEGVALNQETRLPQEWTY